MSVNKRESGSAVVFEAPTCGVVAFSCQGVCYVSPVCTSGLKSVVLTEMPADIKLEESLTLAEFFDLLAKKA